MAKRKAKPRTVPKPALFKAAIELPHAPVPESVTWQVKGRQILIQVKEFFIGKE